MEIEVAALRALAELREAESGLLEEKAVAVALDERFEEHEHPRDRGGRFRRKPMLREPGSVGIPLPGERPPWDPPLHPNIAQRLEAEGLNTWPPFGPVARKLLGSAKDTEDLYSYVDGDGERIYSPEREAIHDRIVDYFLSSHSGPETMEQPLGTKGKPLTGKETPRVLFFAGGTATGKSSALAQAAERGDNDIIPEDAVMVNPDLVKQMLPEFQEMAAAGERAAGSVVHEESSHVAAKIRKQAIARRMNLIVDGTGDSGRAKFMSKIWKAADAGYEVNIFMVDLPLNIAVERAVLRGDLEGRYVPTPEIAKSHYGSSARHMDWRNIDIVSRWQVWSNNVPDKTDPILVASGRKGIFTVHDQYEYARLSAKADRGKQMESTGA